MGTTPTWGLPFPEPADPPLGGSQLTALANEADAALLRARDYPNTLWCAFQMNAINTTHGTTVNPTLTILRQASYTPPGMFTIANGNTLMVNRSGWWNVFGAPRFLNTGTTVSGGYLQVWVDSPPGVNAFNEVTPTFNATYSDVWLNANLGIAVGSGMRFSIYNNSGTGQNLSNTTMWLVWTLSGASGV